MANQIRENMRLTCVGENAKKCSTIAYYNHTLPVLGKNSERTSQLITQAELVGALRYGLFSEGGSWSHPVYLPDVL